MRYLLFLPGIILILLPLLAARRKAIIAQRQQLQREAELAAAAQRRMAEAEHNRALKAAKAAEREKARAEREARQQQKQADRLEAARQRAEYAERELAAKQQMKAISCQPETPAEPETPADQPAKPEPGPAPIVLPAGNNAFKGQVVSFTGRLPGMTRREAIAAVEKNGGKAFTKMPAGTTLLVVGDKPGMCKLDKADEWIAQVRKITAAQFFDMLAQPLTLELDEFAALFAKEVA